MTLEAVALFSDGAGEVFHARQLRRMLQRIVGFDFATVAGTQAGGVARPGDLAVSQRGSGANMSVDVAAGGAMIRGGDSGVAIGTWWAFNDTTVNVPISPSDTTNPRYDLVGLHVRDSEYSGNDNDVRLIVVEGTPAASPSDPSLSAHPNFLTLARVEIPASAGSIVDANITSRRSLIAGIGGTIVCTSTTRPTVSLFEGMTVYETDTNRYLIYDGTGWMVISEPWQDYDPVVSQAGTPVTKTITYGRAARRRTTCHVDVFVAITGSGPGSGDIRVDLRYPSMFNMVPMGVATVLDINVIRVYRMSAWASTDGNFYLRWDRSYGIFNWAADTADLDGLTDPGSYALANGDTINAVGSHSIAAADSYA